MKIKRYSSLPLLLLLVPHIVSAATSVDNPLNFSPPATDISTIFLNNIFGLVDGVLAGTGSQILGQMFGVFNAAVLSLGGIVLIYTLLVGTMNTANEGEMLGKRWSSIWIPVRSAAGVALLIPKASGYCLMQIFVMWVVVQGVGAADKVWGAALNYLAQGGTIIKITKPVTNAKDASMIKASGNILTSATCMYGLQYFLKKQREDNFANGTCTSSSTLWYCKNVPNFSDNIDFVNEKNSAVSSGSKQSIQFPNLDDTLYPNYAAAFNGQCGSVSWTNPDKDKLKGKIKGTNAQATTQLIDQAVQARAIAVEQMYLNLSQVAQAIVTNQFANNEPLPLGQTAQKDTLWQSPDTSKAPLLSGTEVKGAVTAYSTLMQPTLNLLNDSVKGSALTFIPKAYQDGWIMAGSYFFNLVNTNSSINSATTIHPPTADADAATKIDSNFGDNKSIDGLVINKNYIKSLVKLVGTNLGNNQPTASGSCKKGASILENYICNATLLKQPGQPGLTPPVFTSTFKMNWQSIPLMQEQKFSGGWFNIAGNIATLLSDLLITIVNFLIAELNTMIMLYLQPIMALLSKFIAGFAQGLVLALSNNTNPIIAVAQMGGTFINTGVTLWITSAIGSVALSAIPGLGAVGIAVIAFVAPIIFMWLFVMISAGIIMAFYVPLVPYILFTYGAIGWFIGVIEAMVAAPIVALGITHPEGHEAFGKADNAIMLLLNVFLRPAMMVIGLIGGIILSYVGIWLLNTGFAHAVGLASCTNTGGSGVGHTIAEHTGFANVAGMQCQSTATGNFFSDFLSLDGSGVTGQQRGFASLLAGIFVVVIYVVMYMQIVQKAFELINILPDKVLRWLSGGFQESLGQESGRMMQETGQSAHGAAQQTGRMAQESAQSVSRSAKENPVKQGKSGAQGNDPNKSSDAGDNPGPDAEDIGVSD